MRKNGVIVRWDGIKGFGFIRSPESAAELFFHVKNYGSGTPVQGMAVSFEEIHVGGKGPRAMAIQAMSAAAPMAPAARPAHRHAAARRPAPTARQHQRQASTPTQSAVAMPVVIVLYLALLTWAVWQSRLPWWLLPVSLLLNLATFFAYWRDKQAAQQGQWRTPEQTLQWMALAGGWPGAWLAQRVLRHKSRKTSFRLVYAAMVVLHVAALAAWVFQARFGLV